MPNQLLLHLSDIHFNKKDSTVDDQYELDADLRHQLELDVERMRVEIGANAGGIIVSGDIAFAGREAEYKTAYDWLQKLSTLCGAPPDKVWCVPGNHDIDRSIFDKSLNLRNLHNTLRPADPANVDSVLGEVLNDSEAATTLFRPLEQYDRFAAKFRCRSRPRPLAWKHFLELNDQSMLGLYGANSTLVSDKTDDNKGQKLILGTLQATAAEDPGVAVVFICHHPLDWLMDYDQVNPILKARAVVQLFGHKHLQAVEVVDNSLRLVAGAVQPDRREPNWKPRYNWLGFSVAGSGSSRTLEVTLYPRVWSDNEPKFVADYNRCDGGQHKTYRLKLATWDGSRSPTVESLSPAIPVEPSATNPGLTGVEGMNAAKTLAYRYLSLPHLVRLEIAQHLGLLSEKDEGLFDAELFERLLQRATDRELLAQLWNEVEQQYDADKRITSPYLHK